MLWGNLDKETTDAAVEAIKDAYKQEGNVINGNSAPKVASALSAKGPFNVFAIDIYSWSIKDSGFVVIQFKNVYFDIYLDPLP